VWLRRILGEAQDIINITGNILVTTVIVLLEPQIRIGFGRTEIDGTMFRRERDSWKRAAVDLDPYTDFLTIRRLPSRSGPNSLPATIYSFLVVYEVR